MLNRRQQAILAYINEHGEAKNTELTDLIGNCSAMTLWRDLSLLEAEGRIIRYRGGAAAVQTDTDGQGQEINFVRRIRQNTGAKETVANLAAEFILPDQSYYLDAGSTIFTLLHHLRKGNYNFITSAANIAAELATHTNYDVTMLGGQLNSNTISVSGPQAERMLDEMNIDIAVMATSGFSTGSAFTSGRLAEAELKKHVIEKAAFTIMLLDHGKIAKRHPFTFAHLEDVNLLIGDAQIPEDFRAQCSACGIPLFTPDDGTTPEERMAVFTELMARKGAL